jgi:hypothetical protein
MTEVEIEKNALEDPDSLPLPDDFWDEVEKLAPSASNN